MYEFGTTPEQIAMVKVIHSQHAARNPKALYPEPVTVDEVLNSRMICKPLHLLDCCVETDNATCVIVTSADRAKDCRHPPALIRAVAGRVCNPRLDMHYQHGPIPPLAGHYGTDLLCPQSRLGPEEVAVPGASRAFPSP